MTKKRNYMIISIENHRVRRTSPGAQSREKNSHVFEKYFREFSISKKNYFSDFFYNHPGEGSWAGKLSDAIRKHLEPQYLKKA